MLYHSNDPRRHNRHRRCSHLRVLPPCRQQQQLEMVQHHDRRMGRPFHHPPLSHDPLRRQCLGCWCYIHACCARVEPLRSPPRTLSRDTHNAIRKHEATQRSSNLHTETAARQEHRPQSRGSLSCLQQLCCYNSPRPFCFQISSWALLCARARRL